MIQISKLNIGDEINGRLLIKDASKRKTKNNKAFVNFTFTDGETDIQGNFWADSKIAKGTVVELQGTIGSYQGTKNVQIGNIDESDNQDSTEFAPTDSYYDTAVFKDLGASITSQINNPDLLYVVNEILNKYYWSGAPGATNCHHDFVDGWLVHSVNTAVNARQIAFRYEADLDIVTAGGLLHDLGKLRIYEINNAVIEYTQEGQLFEHIVEGVAMLTECIELFRERNLMSEFEQLKHIITSHHGKVEYGSPVVPKTVEAMIVNFADGIDAKLEIARVLTKDLKPGEWSKKDFYIGRQMTKYDNTYTVDDKANDSAKAYMEACINELEQ